LDFKENAYKFNRESMAGGFGWRPAALAGARRLDFLLFFNKTLWIHYSFLIKGSGSIVHF